MGVCGRSNKARATVSWSRSHAPATRWLVLWGCNGHRWRRSGCGSVWTPATSSCAPKPTTINRAARLRELAHGGQTVLSGTTSDLVIDRLPDGAWLTDLGMHPLRDLPRPERVVQLCHPDLRNDFPPLRVPKHLAVGHLPVQLTNFGGPDGQ